MMDLQQLLSEDEEYQTLCLEFTEQNRKLLELILKLPKAQQTIVFDFLDTTGKMFGRILELASDI